ncbi:TonB-dependent receptor [Chryseolinea sp. H1M3-3]|uniref:TonB-dependent receptor n=1 Tax=Chryseolinea sp. H1M3-3 TaxID=3034144 RepID=UPI0023EC7BCE|nr:TonB-dependent receptor [Chryseolinea sp. H1M3-3]
MKKLIILPFILFCFAVLAQQGHIRGKISDGETGEGLFGATILKQGTTTGISSDFEGNYSLALEPGVHTIVISYISYQAQTIENVTVKGGEVTTLDVVLRPDVAQLGEVVVTAEAMRDSELGLMTFQRKSANVLDGASYQTFRKTGDRDLASAIRRVTGVSIQSGKFVYVRGLGDRYTRTTLNGMTIPGLDPDRNDVQIDIFPTSILENVIVYKTFSPNLPGDFTGGIVDVEMKSFPESKTTTVSLGFGFNPDMNLKDNYLHYKGGKTDWLGFDDGTRELPFPSNTIIPNESSNDPQLETLTRSLNPQLGIQRKRSFLNTTFTFNHGNQLNVGKKTIGYTAIFNYQNRYEYYDDIEFGEYTKNDDASQTELFKEEVRKGELSQTSVLWSGLLAGSLKFDKHSFSASVFRTQNGVSEASDRINRNYDETSATLYENILTYSQRSVTNGILSGTHQIKKLRADWKNSFTISRTYDPDFRSTSISITDPENPTINRGDGAGIRRFWRDLNEFNENLKLDFTLPYGKSNKLQFGAMGIYKDREFKVDSYLLDATSRSGVPLDPDYFLQPENIWTADGQRGTYLEGNYEAPNNYEANSSVYAGYVMTEMTFQRLKAVFGARVEKADMFYTGADIFGNTFDNDHTLDELDILPSVNLVYSLTETMSLRGSFGQTLARPSFKEKSAAQIYDPITKRFYNGNLNLNQTMINNYDLRWENFFVGGGGDMIALSLFYKQFDGHIELVTFDVAPDNVRPRNSGESVVYGMEFEFKKKLDFITPSLSGLSFGTNVSLANSEVDLESVIVNESGLNEFQSRQFNARAGETIDKTRPMGGQSPYLINAYLNFTDKEGTMNANVSYNVQGESLFIIGVGAVPDIYTQPFHSLNFNVYRNFGAENKHRITFRTDNILKSEKKDLYKSHGDAEAIYSVFKPGRTFTVSYSLTF